MNLKRISNKILTLAAALFAMAGITACNEKSDISDKNKIEPSLSVAVSNFKLNPNARVMANLDSVFFSIDLDHAVIFNADSLPKGTNITKLVPVITFPSNVETAELTMTGGTVREGTVDYRKTPGDSIDFTGNVTLRLTTDGGELSREYTIKVNVHKAVADSLMWDKVAMSTLPSRLANPAEQKTVSLGRRAYSLIEESNGTLTLSHTDDAATGRWTKTALNPGFNPQIRSFTASDGALWLLDDTGRLMTSADGAAWTACGEIWQSILGGYGDCIIGIAGTADAPLHDIYPRPAGYTPSPLEEDFPLTGASNTIGYTTKWASNPYVCITGGEREGKLLSDTWGFDGKQWAKISNKPLPALRNALLVPYFVYRKTSTLWIQTEYSITLCLGGRLSDGSLSRTVYLSYDNGVNWTRADQLMQLPDYIPSLTEADAFIGYTSMQATLDSWLNRDTPQPAGARVQYFVNGSEVEWECPYIYLAGGRKSDGTLSDALWRAVLARLTFAPIF